MPAGRAAILSKPNVINPGLALLQNSTLWLDAGDAVAGAQWLRNKGTGGRALDARVGSVGQAQIVKGALKLANIGSQGTTRSDAAVIRPTGDIEVVVRVSLLDWSPVASQTILSCGATTAATMNYRLSVHPSGAILFERYASGGGGGNRYAYSTTGPSIVDGNTIWIKATCDIDNGAGGSDFKFYTAPDQTSEPLSWTQLGTTVTTATDGTGVGNSNTSGLFIGQLSSGNSPMAGSVFRAMVRNGIGGSVVFDADFTTVPDLATSFTESSSNAATVTVNSISGVDTNDPLPLPHTGTNYLYLPGTTGNNATAPYISAYGFNGSFELVSRVSATDWTPAGFSTIIGLGSATIAFQLRLLAAGTLELYFNVAGAGGQFATSATPAVTDGQTIWIKVTRNVTNGVVQFFTAPDQSAEPSSWTQLGTDLVRATQTLVATTEPMWVGASNNAQLWTGNIYRTIVRNGIGGTTVFDANFTTNTNQNSFNESSSNAATVTINRSATGRKSAIVTRPTFLFGTDDYLEIPDNDLLDFGLTDSFTVMSIYRKFGVGYTSVAGFIVAKQDSVATNGWRLGYDNTIEGMTIRGPSAIAASRTPQASGVRALSSVVRNVVADNLTPYENATAGTPVSDTTTVTLANSMPVRVGRMSGTDSYYADAEIEHVMIFRSALTSVELGHIAAYLGAI